MVRAVFGSSPSSSQPRFVSRRYLHVFAAFVLASASQLGIAACSTAELKPLPPPGSTDPTGEGPVVDEEGNPVTPNTGADAGPARPPDPAASLAMTSNVTIQVEPTDSGAAILAAIK